MKTLVVAFDGLDKELIEKFELENIRQEKFGSIDNKTNITSISTSELFASFITGEYSDQHGVKGLEKWTNPKVKKFEELVDGIRLFDKFKGLRNAIFESINSLDAKKRRYRKEDLKCAAVFEELDNSRALFVPSYNPSLYWVIGGEFLPLKYGYSKREIPEFWDTREYSYREKELFSELDSDIIPVRNLLMCHFHRPDVHQHIYGDEDINYDENKLQKLYKETDKLAGKIKEKALRKGYERIIFMSDHGLPAQEGHNENAFYSSNKKLFENKEPKITDFYDKLVN